MPDPMLILQALAVTGLLAGLVVLICGLPPAPRMAIAWVLGVGGAFYLGCRLLGLWPRWPPREDLDRLLLIVLPAALAVELVSAFPQVPRALAWLLRLAVAAGAAPVLLYKSTYFAGSGKSEWTPEQTALIFGGLGATLIAVWALLALLARLTPGRSVAAALALTSAASAVAVMLSGYATGGQLGLPLTTALLGAVVASLLLRNAAGQSAAIGFGVVALYSLLVIGRFFGELTTTHAVMLGLAPLLCWIPELPYLRRMAGWVRGLARLAVVAVPLVLAVVQAQHRFVENSAASATPDSGEPTLQDYMDFGNP
jgi:hypothetical protein